MELTISGIDYAPDDLYSQTPFSVELLRELPGKDRPDYWLARLHRPLNWFHSNNQRQITHLILAARWQGTRIDTGVSNLPVGIAYVTDQSLLADTTLDFKKCEYIAIGIASDTSGGRQVDQPKHWSMGLIGRFFGLGSH